MCHSQKIPQMCHIKLEAISVLLSDSQVAWSIARLQCNLYDHFCPLFLKKFGISLQNFTDGHTFVQGP